MTEKPKITLLGASGAVGRLYLDLALTAGFEVLALVRDPSKLDQRDGLTIMKGDVTNDADIIAAVAEANVVVSSIGNTNKALVMERTTRLVLDAARAQPALPKCIFISSLGCSGTSWLIKMVSILLGGKKVFEDYDKADALISGEAAVPYVLVRPTGYTDGPGTGRYTIFRSGVTFAKLIPRADVAQFLFDATTATTWDGPGGVQLGGFNEKSKDPL